MPAAWVQALRLRLTLNHQTLGFSEPAVPLGGLKVVSLKSTGTSLT